MGEQYAGRDADRNLPAERSGVRFLIVTARSEGQRLDNFLLRELPGVPKTRLYKALRKGEVRVNRGRAKPGQRLTEGDSVRLPPLHQPARRKPPPVPWHWAERLAGRVVLEDENLLVINKPSGLAVHGGSGVNLGLIECLRQLRPEDRDLELVHRLDRDTSGLILVARRPRALKALHEKLRGDGVEKVYLALVAGRWPRGLHEVDAPLEKQARASGERVVRASAAGRRSLTRFRVVERFPTATLVEARPVTGRTHQIRVHALHAGHPLVGDVKYQGEREATLAEQGGLERLFLHAWRLCFSLGDPLRAYDLVAPLDPDLEDFLEKLRNTMKKK
ncbi:RluA family pseudouridine synthase [Pseudohaliea rubra]|uniref:Pseudouridine synthase n=1 Tax=Pseudohaliea rubra DSM 19751 TaxID=1265313 RepID=A0A095VRB2_9GAMM|nr:RluA family pseudouridine synthase [Pseudohaliea rubra]KGE03588.1 Ribosomal large subunit pseudouridine synthase C [Pseudohaliea rubra DSM 19751]